MRVGMRGFMLLALFAVGCEYQTHDLPFGQDPVDVGDDAGADPTPPPPEEQPDAGHINPAPPEVIELDAGPEDIECERKQDCPQGYDCDELSGHCVEADDDDDYDGPG